jgi:hypothetical protein
MLKDMSKTRKYGHIHYTLLSISLIFLAIALPLAVSQMDKVQQLLSRANIAYALTVTDSFDTPVTNGLEKSSAKYSLFNPTQLSVKDGSANFSFPRCNTTIGFGLQQFEDLDSDATVTFKYQNLPSNGQLYVFHTARVKRDDLSYRLDIAIDASGNAKMYWGKLVNSNGISRIGSEISLGKISPNTNYQLRAKVSGQNPTSLQAKVWTDGTTEPAIWALSTTDTQAELQSKGKVGFRSYLGGSCSSATTVLALDNLKVVGSLASSPVPSPVASPVVTPVVTPTPSTVPSSNQLTWAPPALTNPITIEVKNTGAVHYPVSMDTTKDYIIKLPANEPLRGGLSLNGGRNVVLIGGVIEVPNQGENPTISNRRMFKTQFATGTVHIEGVLGRGADISEGMQLISPDTTIQIQNVRIENLHARDQVNFTDNHPDLIQVIAGPKELRVDKFTGSTDYQGIFIKPETQYSAAGNVTMKRVNVIGLPTARYQFWTTDRVGSILLDQFYVDVPTQHPWGFGKTIMPDVNTFAAPRRATLAKDEQGRDYATWSGMTGPTITGRVTEGLPPSGDFVPAGSVGLGYVSPGYVGITPTAVPTPQPSVVPTPSPSPVVVTPTVSSLTLINAATDKDIRTLSSGTTIDLAQGSQLNIRANADTQVVKSVKFVLDNSTTRVESSVPFSFAGDSGGNYTAWTPAVGSHTMVVTPYTGVDNQGTAGTPLTVTFNVTRTASPSPTPRPTPVPTPIPTPIPSPLPTPTGSPTSADPSGESMPIGDLPGWKQIYTENFSRSADKGKFMNVYSDNFWQIYSDNYPDTAGKNWGQPSVYYPSKVLSVGNGVLTKNVHVENGKPMAAGMFAKVNKSDKEGAQLYGKYTIRFRVYANNSTSLKGFKMAWLLWPKSQKWPKDGEIDFPEGDFAGKIWAAMHRQEGTSGDDQDLYFSNTGFDGQWHTASMEWGPDKMVFILDGKVLGTSTKRIPNTPMFWVIQTESCYDVCPNANANGNVEIDWMTAYSRVQ